ncbi:hypothetical protein MTR67_007372 [Solanum verrucosum]|uniref:CCHC-type domain-containing protein n=1 Tax=Solanum verrucosum TaxID=315347 RepID=A0AAF0TAJ6_SOLVR|nr:hypothetical protein MTR67_007372 [Solanum verrucosum]
MGDHIVEFGKILDYKDELLRTNLGSTCVVKLGESDALGRPIFQSFYICFDPLKKAFRNCRKCIGLDGCFLKGVCRGQLLVAMAKYGNNQMLPLAWAVVEYEKKETWTWFIKLLKEDLGLGDGEDLTLITDMQKEKCCKDEVAWSRKMMDDLMYYNIEYWSRHKTIITMLDEIRVKMMTRITKLREFTNTWMCDFSPMSLKVLHENIDRSMNCNIEFNGVDGFEVKEGPFQHSVDLGRWTCSCRVWQLKGILYAHDVAAIYFKKCEPLDYIDNCYSKATYLRTYANVLQPVTNMEMWPVSTNPTVAPLEIKSMLGRTGKLRKKEASESKKSGKLPRTGLAMTCSNCNVRGHNKRECPQRVESSTREEPSNTDKGNGKTSGLGRPKKAQTKGEHSTKRSRGRPPAAPSVSPGHAKRSRGRPPAAPSASPGPAKRSRGRPLAEPTKGARGRPPIAPATPNASAAPAKSARGRPPAAASAPPICPSPANYHVGSSTPADYQLTNSNKGRGRGRGSTTSYKRQTVIGMGVFQDENGFKALNPGMSSCKIFSIGTTKVTKSADVTRDIGYKPSTAPKLKWNGKAAISTRKLQEMREEQRKKIKRK